MRRVVTQRIRGGEAGSGGQMSPKMQAYMRTEHQLFNKPAGKRTTEYWEGSFWLYAATLAFAGFSYAYLPNTDITDWARDEAEERAARRANGLPVEYGVNYAALKFQQEWAQLPGTLPVRASDIDEDDE